MAGQKNLAHRKEARIEAAQKLLTARAARTDAQQLEMLDKMFGKGKGAKKERTRLNKNIAANKKTNSNEEENKNGNA